MKKVRCIRDNFTPCPGFHMPVIGEILNVLRTDTLPNGKLVYIFEEYANGLCYDASWFEDVGDYTVENICELIDREAALYDRRKEENWHKIINYILGGNN